MLDVIWTGGDIASMEPACGAWGTIRDAALGVKDGRIAWIGPMADLPDRPRSMAREVRDFTGQWITPGLIDCHTHLVHGGDRAHEFAMRLRGASSVDISRAGGGIASTVAATRAADEEELMAVSARRLAALTAEGVTTVEVKSGYGLDLETESRQLQVARRLGQQANVTVRTSFLGAHALPEEFAGRADDYMDFLCNDVLPALAAAGLADAVDACCGPDAFSPAQTGRLFQRATELGLPVKLHADQLPGVGGAALAADYGALSADHLEYVCEEGVRAMAAAGTVAVLLPGAFYTLRETRLPPVELFRQHGVPMAVATDCNPGSSPSTSLLLMLNMACTLFRLTPEEALAGVTRNAAAALGLAQTHGTLAEGKVADFCIWDIADPVELSYRIGFNPLASRVRAGNSVRGGR